MQTEASIGFKESIYGTELNLRLSPNGSTPANITTRVPAGIKDGAKIKIKGRGVKKGLNAGDLMITLDVAIPQRVDGAAKKAIEDFAKATNDFNPRSEFAAKAKL